MVICWVRITGVEEVGPYEEEGVWEVQWRQRHTRGWRWWWFELGGVGWAAGGSVRKFLSLSHTTTPFPFCYCNIHPLFIGRGDLKP